MAVKAAETAQAAKTAQPARKSAGRPKRNAKTASISMRVDPEIKSEAEEIYESLGLTLTDAINMFLYKSVMECGLPFEVKQPRYNAETEAAMEEARAIVAGVQKAKRYNSVEELMADLDREDGELDDEEEESEEEDNKARRGEENDEKGGTDAN